MNLVIFEVRIHHHKYQDPGLHGGARGNHLDGKLYIFKFQIK